MSIFGMLAEGSLKAPMEAVKAKATVIMVVVALAAAAGAYSYHKIVVASLTSRLNLAEEDVSMLNKANATLRGNVVTLSKSIEKQNQAIADMIKAQQTADALASAALARAQQNVALWRKEYQKVLNAPRPPGDDCTAFKTKLDGYVEVRKQEMKADSINAKMEPVEPPAPQPDQPEAK